MISPSKGAIVVQQFFESGLDQAVVLRLIAIQRLLEIGQPVKKIADGL